MIFMVLYFYGLFLATVKASVPTFFGFFKLFQKKGDRAWIICSYQVIHLPYYFVANCTVGLTTKNYRVVSFLPLSQILDLNFFKKSQQCRKSKKEVRRSLKSQQPGWSAVPLKSSIAGRLWRPRWIDRWCGLSLSPLRPSLKEQLAQLQATEPVTGAQPISNNIPRFCIDR